MRNRSVALIAVAAICCASMVALSGCAERPSQPPPAAGGSTAGRPQPSHQIDPGDRETVMLTVRLPGAGEEGPGQARPGPGMPGRPGGGHSGCPQTEVGRMLGINIANPHGCVIGGVVPKGPAAEAGLLQGDSIVACNGVEVTCPASLLPELQGARAKGSAELKVLRPASEGAGKPKETPQAEAGSPQAEQPAAEPGRSGDSNQKPGQ